MNEIAQSPPSQVETFGRRCQFEKKSFIDAAGDCHQLMVYGYSHIVEELDIKESLSTLPTIEKVFTWSVGYWPQNTVEGREIQRIEYDIIPMQKSTKQFCKAGIVDLVLENYKRKQEGLSLIPLIFCIDSSFTPYPFKIENIATREGCENQRVTHKELRRCFKLCSDFENEEIRKLAYETFKFIKFTNDGGDYLKFEKLSPFWESSEWEKLWENRKQTSKPQPRRIKHHPWRNELQKAIDQFKL